MEVGEGLREAELAKMVGVAEMTIVNWEKGKTKPAQGKSAKIKNILKSNRADWKPWPLEEEKETE